MNQPRTEDYHANRTHISRSMLATFAESRRLYEGIYVTETIEPEDENDNMRIGTGVHAVSLNDVFALSRIVEIPAHVLTSDGKRRGNKWDEFVAEHAGKTLMLPKQIEIVNRCSDAIGKEIGGLLQNGNALTELEISWDDILPCRCRLDFVVEGPDDVLVIDLKTAADITPRGFSYAVDSCRYWLQDAHYSAGAFERFRKPVKFIFAAVEKNPKKPIRCFTYMLPEYYREQAAERRRELLIDLKECQETGDFRESQEGIVTPLEMRGSPR